jgi:hypothetical protein
MVLATRVERGLAILVDYMCPCRFDTILECADETHARFQQQQKSAEA